jgi:HK97 family phage major capsid protein
MTRSDNVAGDGRAIPPAQSAGSAAQASGLAADFKAALAAFTNDLGVFRAGVEAKLQQQEERLTMLDRKSVAGLRPALAVAAEPSLPHQKAFDAYVRSGDDDALRGLVLEGKAMSSSVAADGGYLVSPRTAETIQGVLRSQSSIRSLANVVAIDGGAFEVLVDHTEFGSGWATETTATTETGTPAIDKILIPLHELSALPKVSQRLLDDSAFDVEDWLAERIGDRFARAEAAAFVSGNGVDKPRGFLDHTKVANATWAWGSIGYIATGVAGGFAAAAPGDALVDLVYALGARYRANGTFVMNSRTAGRVRKIKDADGRFLWSDGLAAAEPARLLGYPVLIAEDMPDVANDAFAIAFGDFRSGYTIAERPDLRVLRDPFSAKPNVLFYATKRVGGGVSDYAAIKLLRFAVS